MNEYARSYCGGQQPESALEIDVAIAHPAAVTLEELEALSVLEPYGSGNARPLFCLLGATLLRTQNVGQNRHLKLRLGKGCAQFDGIFFSTVAERCGCHPGDRVDAAFEHVEDTSPHAKFGKWTTDRYDFKAFKKTMIKWQEELQGKAWNSLFLGNHDQPRSVSRFGNDNPAYRETSAKMLATCLHMMQGTPYVYQGEELGMTNAYFTELKDYRDIESIQYFHEYTEAGIYTPEYMMKCLMLRGRDNARTPMQWEDSHQAGFTEGTPWIRVNSNYKEINAKQQLSDPNSIFHYYQKLIRLRKEKPVIVYGTFEALYRDHDQIFAYTRTLEGEKLLTVCNFSEHVAEMEIPEEFQKNAECLITNLGRKDFGKKVVLKPYEAFVLYRNL